MTKLTPCLLALALLLPACSDESDGGDYPWNPGGDSASAGDSNATGDSGSGGWTGGPLPADELCDRFAEVICNAEPSCCTDSTQSYPSVDACITAELAACEADIEPAALDVRTGYNETTAGQKLLELQTLGTTCDPTAGAWIFSEDGFFAALDGSVASGGDCTPATIIPSPDFAALLSCTGGEGCLLSIGMTGISGTCGARGGVGAGCFSDLECQPDHWCDPPWDIKGGGGTCFARVADGQSCTANEACLSLYCNGVTCATPSVNDAYCLNN